MRLLNSNESANVLYYIIRTQFLKISNSDFLNDNHIPFQVVETVMTIHLEYPPGDILVFLTGQEEIETCCDRLFNKAEDIDYDHDVDSDVVEAILILPLYGSLTTGN